MDIYNLRTYRLMRAFNDEYPYPACFEIETDYQRELWSKMQELGYAKLCNSVRCGFELIAGEYVHLTKLGHAIARAIEGNSK